MPKRRLETETLQPLKQAFEHLQRGVFRQHIRQRQRQPDIAPHHRGAGDAEEARRPFSLDPDRCRSAFPLFYRRKDRRESRWRFRHRHGERRQRIELLTQRHADPGEVSLQPGSACFVSGGVYRRHSEGISRKIQCTPISCVSSREPM
jgi:hypothetical protein